jgi:cytochrome P450 family 9
MDLITDTIRQRRLSKIKRNDLVDLMMAAAKTELDSDEEKDSGISEDTEDESSKLCYKRKGKELDDELIIATAVVLFVTGYETTSTALSLLLWLLAKNPEVQTKLQSEVDRATENGGELGYDQIQALEYLDMVIHETVRLFAIVPVTFRQCTKTYTIPGTNVTIPKGTEVQIPTFCIHRDPRYFPDPMRFDPERFTKKARELRHPAAYMGFGYGPRNCIGSRFAMLESKVALVEVVRRFEVVCCAETPKEATMDPHQFLLNTKDKLWLKFVSRQQ